MKTLRTLAILAIALLVAAPKGSHAEEPAKVNYGFYVVPIDKTLNVNVLELEAAAKQSLTDCGEAVSRSEPGTYVAKVQMVNRTVFGTIGALAMYSIICWKASACSYQDYALWGGLAMGTYVGISSLGDYFSEKARYQYNEVWYCMVLAGDDLDQPPEHRFLAFPSENVPDGEVRFMTGLTRYEMDKSGKYPLKKYRDTQK